MTAVNTLSLDWNDLNSSTALKVLDKAPKDQVFTKNVLLDRMFKNGKGIDGGAILTQPIQVGRSNTGTYSGFQKHSVESSDLFSTADFAWGNYYTYVTLAKDDIDRNNGTPKLFDIVKYSWENALSSLRYDLNTDLHADGVTGVTGTDCIVGLKAAVALTPTNTYGGIDRSVHTFWKNETVDWATAGPGGAGTLTNFDHYYLQEYVTACSDEDDKIDLITCNSAVWHQIYKKADANMRMPWKEGMKFGVSSMMLGDIPIILDKREETDYCRLHNTRHMRINWLTSNYFAAGPWIISKGQFAQTKYCTVSLQFVCDKPQRQCVIQHID